MNFFDKPTFNRHVREKHELEFVYACSVLGCSKRCGLFHTETLLSKAEIIMPLQLQAKAGF